MPNKNKRRLIGQKTHSSINKRVGQAIEYYIHLPYATAHMITVEQWKNFGHANSGVNDGGTITQKFYYCFIKLSNSRIMQVLEVENFDDHGSPIGNSLHVYSEPRFDFNGTFEDYWESQWTYDTDKNDFTDPTEEEVEISIEYYSKNFK